MTANESFDEKAITQPTSTNQFFHTVINALPFPFLVIGLDYRVVLANQFARQAHGISEDTPVMCYQLTHRQ